MEQEGEKKPGKQMAFAPGTKLSGKKSLEKPGGRRKSRGEGTWNWWGIPRPFIRKDVRKKGRKFFLQEREKKRRKDRNPKRRNRKKGEPFLARHTFLLK